ncbi:uncharacterized protein C8A04DRAFT_25632 [Dichotomopilus funicola]|uniref:GPI inositol-deacylase n=1 Tax=Dichotomopilus funicola TaxID=1934379 RepID=A0AAN6V8M6_9PEZI|nr:hypothetical protein C8A04DRAFT_25632 [Dichotomopilus funicola]
MSIRSQTLQSSSTWMPGDQLAVSSTTGRQPSPTSLRGRLQSLRRTTTLSKPSHSNESTRGPLGLNLLHEPSEPRVDFVFVHGLGGGSRRTWSASSDPASYWPKEWLPSEPGFRHVRIHSFGYDSDWTKSQQSSLTMHDFGQALLADLYNSPHMRKNGNTPIVLVAHSMGGLVVKKAYLMARRDPIYADIANRIHSLYFLGTPHRGADSSALITTLLSMSIGPGSKAFVKEMIPGSGTLQNINDEFRHVCSDVGIWSFFEGLPTSTGPSNTIIVEKESAVMGLPREHTQYLQANHRRLVKFDSPEDPNYNILLRSFNTTIEEIEKHYTAEKSESHRIQMKQLAHAFDVAERPDGDFIRMLDKLHTGSCEWLTGDEAFQDWLECDPMYAAPDTGIKTITSGPAKDTPRFLWLNGPPGSGKSVASGHVIRYLESLNLDCAYFFFKSNEKPSLTQFLLSMALQMAETNFQIRHTFLAMMEEGEGIDSHSDHVMVWNNIFLGRIFKMAMSQPQFWVIDALDECQARLLGTLMSMFSRIEPNVPLRIFITSRPNGHVERLLNQERIMRTEMHTGQAESLRDIDAFVRSRLSPSIIEDFNAEDGDLVAEIIEKSNGIFLWASLIMTRLDEAHSIEAMRTTLDQVPTEMSGMYSGILETIAESPNAELAHCVLKWVVCARKPLTTEELREVVRLDINQTLRTADRFAQVCGNLITVDENYVQVMHQTVKEFLTGEQSDYYIPRSWSHARIAELCLQHLNSRSFSPPRTRRVVAAAVKVDPRENGSSSSSSANGAVKPGAFDDYAASNFSYHLAHCSPSENTLHLLPLLGTFFGTNVLTWIERAARTGRLSLLTRTIQNLKGYLTRQVATSSPLDANYQLTTRFVDDLVRLSAIYGPNLLTTPSCIHTLVPLLCPRSSIIHWKFATGGSGPGGPSSKGNGRGGGSAAGGQKLKQRVLSSFNNDWDERLSSLAFSSRALSIACAESFFAVGLGDGEIRVYRQSTFELLSAPRHGEPVRRLANGNFTGVLLSGGLRSLKMWGGPRHDVLLWSTTVPDQPLSFRFSQDDTKVYVPLRSGEVYVFRTKTGARLDALPILEEEASDSESDGGGGEQQQKRITPMLIRISPMLGIAAIAYKSSHLKISYYDSDERVEAFEKEGYEDGGLPPQVLDVAFNENAEQNLMAVAYQDGDLVTLDPWTLQQQNAYHLNAHTLAASPDGHTLAAGDSECVISLFAFDGLRLICRIQSLEERIMGIVFASNNLRFFDLRGNTCNVWEPAVLIKKNLADDTSSEEADDYLMPASNLVCTRSFEDNKAITVMTQAGDSNFVFCGHEEGSITVHDVSSGKVCAEFQFHARMVEIRHLEWNAKTKVLFSVDASRRCIATRLTLPAATTSITTAVQKQQQQLKLQQFEHILDFRASDTVLQALVSPDGCRFLVSTQSGEEQHVFNEERSITQTAYSQNKARWLAHPTDPQQLLLFESGSKTLHVFRWEGLERQTPESGIPIHLPPEMTQVSPEIDLTEEWHSRSGLTTLVQTLTLLQSSSSSSSYASQTTAFLTLDLAVLSEPYPTHLQITCTTRQLASPIKSLLGIHRSNLFFVSGRGWVCSIGLKTLKTSTSYVRHFFVPSVWQTGGSADLIARVVSKGTVAMAHRDEVVVLQGFLEFEHKTAFGEEESAGGRAVAPAIRGP